MITLNLRCLPLFNNAVMKQIILIYAHEQLFIFQDKPRYNAHDFGVNNRPIIYSAVYFKALCGNV
jgi:hypothetical protein